jgi:mono/diheme cytochrome c family protein
VVSDFAVDESIVRQGARLYGTYCTICHGIQAVANAMAPDLRASAAALNLPVFAEAVREGTLVHRAMPAFAAFEDEEMEAMRHYIRAVAHRDAATE